MIKKIKYDNHIVLGNLELDFSKPDGSFYNTIVLAGLNGSGKTTILDTLSDFLNLKSFHPFDSLIYEADGCDYELTTINERDSLSGFHKRRSINTGEQIEIRRNEYNNYEVLQKDNKDIRFYGFAYSRARSGFRTSQVQSITSSQLDSDKYTLDAKEDFTSVKQLLIDIFNQDNNSFARLGQTEDLVRYSEFEPQSKLYRFKQAFNNFFETLRLERVETKGGFNIIFSKNGKEIKIDDLSTGEKQIVFRGAMLLKNSNAIKGGIVLIDEPELSLHPQWQQKILQYYRNLFTTNGVQTAQIIIATHSEYVLSSALKDPDNVLVITLKDENGNIQCEKITTPYVLPSITAAEINYKAFNIYSTDYHIALYGYLQNKIHAKSVKACDNYISHHPKFDARKHRKSSSHNGTTYNTLPTFIRNLIDHPQTGVDFTEEELQASTELLIELCK